MRFACFEGLDRSTKIHKKHTNKLLCFERSPPGHRHLAASLGRAIITVSKCTFRLAMCISESNAHNHRRFEMHIQAGNVHFKI